MERPDPIHKEQVVIQAVLADQYRRIEQRLENIYQELNGKGGLKECLTLMQQQHTSMANIYQDIYGEHGMKVQLAVMRQQLVSQQCIGKWLAGIFSTLIVLSIAWFVAEQW